MHVQRAVDAAKKAAVEHFLFLSLIECDNKSTQFAKQYKEAEEIIQRLGLVWTFLRVGFFQETLIHLSPHIQQVKLPLSIQNGKFAPISMFDIAEAATVILLGRIIDHAFKIYNLTGSEIVDGHQIANMLSIVLNKKVDYISLSHSETLNLWKLLGFDEWAAKGFSELFDMIAKNHMCFISNDAEFLIGRKPTPLMSTINIYKNYFLPTTEIKKEKEREEKLYAHPQEIKIWPK